MDSNTNLKINNEEYLNGDICLRSTPVELMILYGRGDCNAKCYFCNYRTDRLKNRFGLDNFKDIENKTADILKGVSYLRFAGLGELNDQDALEVFGYLDKHYPETTKSIVTNGSLLFNPRLVDTFINGNYQINVSIHASNNILHTKMSGLNNFDAICVALKKIMARKYRCKNNKLKVYFIHVLNVDNLSDLPDFIKFSSSLGIEGISTRYMIIKEKRMLEKACFFRKKITDEVLDKADSVAKKLEFKFQRHPKFSNEERTTEKRLCRYPWKAIWIKHDYSVTPCGSTHEAIPFFKTLKTEDLKYIWNCKEYKNLRKSLLENKAIDACKYCFRYPQCDPNDIMSHLSLGMRNTLKTDKTFRDTVSKNLTK